MSGVPMPLSSRLAEPDGGKFAGIRMIVVGTAVLLEHVPERLAVRATAPRAPLDSGNCQPE